MRLLMGEHWYIVCYHNISSLSMLSVKLITTASCTLADNSLLLGMPMWFCSPDVLVAYQKSVVYLFKLIYASCACDCNYIILLYIMNNDEVCMQKKSFYIKTKLYVLQPFNVWITNICYPIRSSQNSCKILW